MVDTTRLDLAEQAAKPTWWGAEGDDLAAGPADIHRMIAAGMSEGLPVPIAVDTRPWATEAIIQEWWHHHDAGPWAVTQQRRGRYIYHRSYGHWRGWRIVILHVTEDEQ